MAVNINTILNKNGNRQAQDSICSELNILNNIKLTKDASSVPTVNDAINADTNVARFLLDTISEIKVTPPGNSPPTKKPCKNLRIIKPVMVASLGKLVGNNAINKVGITNNIMVSENTFFRPSLSPRCPQNIPPNGLEIKATVKIAKIPSHVLPAKNSLINTLDINAQIIKS